MAKISSPPQSSPSGAKHHVSGFVIVVSAIAAIGGLLFGYDTGVISGAILFIKQQFGLDSSMQEFTVSAVLIGSVPGAALGGILGDRFGRRNMIMLAAIIFGVGALVTAFTPNLDILIFGRIIVGVGIGIASFISPIHVYLGSSTQKYSRHSRVSEPVGSHNWDSVGLLGGLPIHQSS